MFGKLAAFYKQIYWRCSPSGIKNNRALTRFQDIHMGERCFIIGNGPSLNKMDLRALSNEVTFGMNRFYLLFDEIGFHTSYYLAINRLVLEQFGSEIIKLPMPIFIRWETRDLLQPSPYLMYIRVLAPSFSKDIRKGAWGGATVTYAALQVAFYMGFQQVILIGVDHSFQVSGKPHQEITSAGKDRNHFSPEYFGKGIKWHLPDLETSEIAYHMANDAFKGAGRSILDATVAGKLDIFPKISYEEVLKTPPPPTCPYANNRYVH